MSLQLFGSHLRFGQTRTQLENIFVREFQGQLERPLWVAVSTGRRNTRTKPRHSGFGPEGLTGLSKVLEHCLPKAFGRL